MPRKERKSSGWEPPAEGTRPLPADKRRRDIREAAVRCFLQRGFGATRLTDIAQEAKLSKGGIFFYYPAKEALFQDILQDRLRRLEARWSFQPASDGPADHTLRRLVVAHVRTVEEEREETQLQHVLVATTSQDPSLGDKLGEVFAVMRGLYEGVIGRGIEEGTFAKGDPETLAHCVLAMVQGLAYQSATDANGRTPVAADAVADLVLRMLGARTQPSAKPDVETDTSTVQS